MLADGSKVSKSDSRIDSYGNVDELNSYTGLLRDQIRQLPEIQDLQQKLSLVQNELFDVGGELATPFQSLNLDAGYLIQMDAIERLEKEIDEMNEQLPNLKNFVLPGGHSSNSVAHICRTICRRCERSLVKLKMTHEVREELPKYLNRLSDWYFVVSRYISLKTNTAEILWQQKKTR
ncbi:MAG: cob(I)yrinic acid a,c-diamide adenosyltransferase [Pseudobacteriovorax sp.]|nr:cob(I)yrinic acid a,c-diamide adenosyltransferase [Pseudobacteriovorax sp.]